MCAYSQLGTAHYKYFGCSCLTNARTDLFFPTAYLDMCRPKRCTYGEWNG